MTTTDHIKAVTTHTPGPWHVHNHVHVHAARGQRIASVQGEFGNPAKNATARRIVAAVNACEGISTEALETNAIMELLQALQNAVARLEGDDEHHPPDIGQMRAAIAKATGAPA
jgi:hypothetical protein